MKKWFKYIFSIVLLLALGFSTLPARAASAPTVMVEPVEVTTTVGAEIEIQILVIGGVDVNAYDLTLTYDPDVLRLESWEHGDYLSNHWVVQNIDEPGLFQIADAQLGLPPVSGDGTLLVLTFTTIDEGESDLALEDVTLADDGGNMSIPVMEDGRVVVSMPAGPSLMPTLTPTRTPTPTWTPATGAQAPTAKPTSTQRPTGSDPVSAGAPPQEGYPVEETTPTGSLIDETAYPQGTQGDPAVTETPDDIAAGNSDLSDESPTSDGRSNEAGQSTSEPPAGLDVLLWIVLAAAVLALGVMVIILIRRRRDKLEDLLL
ncbi:MAG: cohesin domain-containing protein [Chloroflexota bacterium]|nr:cohesin domain-containing protein [Chloroflexota bacterium]